MKFKGKLKYYIIFSALFLFVYIFAAAVPLGSDMYFLPLWTADIRPHTENNPISETEQHNTLKQAGFSPVQDRSEQFAGTDPRAFIIGNQFGYFTADGTILRIEKIEHRISASSHAWTRYTEDSQEAIIYSPAGSKMTAIESPGFIHIDANRIYVFEPGGNTIAQFNQNGQRLWRFAHTAPITAFQSSPAGTIIGYSDGKLVCINPSGEQLLNFYPGGSDYQVILGAALSEDGSLAACVSGINKQRAILIKLSENQYKIIHHTYLENSLHRQVFVDFDNLGKYAVFESAQGIGIIDCKQLRTAFIPEKAKILSVGIRPQHEITALLTQDETTCTLSVVEQPTVLLAQTDFISENSFLLQEENHIFLGTDSKLLGIEIRGVK